MSTTISIEKKKYIRALKVRLYPNEEQEIIINKTFGCCRKVYNIRIDERTEFYCNTILPLKDAKKSQKEINEAYKLFSPSTEKQLKEKFEYFKDVSSSALQQSRMNCEQAFKNFFKSLKDQKKDKKKKKKNKKSKQKFGFPNYKSRKDNTFSYQEPQCKFDLHFRKNEREIKIAKLGWVKFFERKYPKWFKIVEKFGTITISKEANGRYYCSILCYLKHDWLEETPKNRKEAIGLDFSPSDLYFDSEGNSAKEKYGYVAQKQAHLHKLHKLHKRLNRKQRIKIEGTPYKKNSNNREKARTKLAQLESRISNKRKEYIEKETLRLVRNYDKIVVEDLNLKGISKFLPNAKNMVDTSWYTFTTKLIWKGKTYGCNVIKADRFFPSSQLCSDCGYQYKQLTLNVREWTCPNCGQHHIRDVNAAINLKNYVPRERWELTSVESENTTSILVEAILAEEAENHGCEAVVIKNL